MFYSQTVKQNIDFSLKYIENLTYERSAVMNPESIRFKRTVVTDGERIHEIVTANNGLPWGLAIVEMEHSPKHLHKATTELYVLLVGSIIIWVEGHTREIERPGTITILPGEAHKVLRAEPGTVLAVYSWPPFDPKDYYLVE